MKFKSIIFLCFICLITLSACGGLESKVKGTYATKDQVIVIDDEKYTMYDKGDPDNPTGISYYSVVSKDNGTKKLVVDLHGEDKDGDVVARENWYKYSDDEILMLMETGGEFQAYKEKGLNKYKPAK